MLEIFKGKKNSKKNIIMLRPFTGFKFIDFKKIINKKLKKMLKKIKKFQLKIL